MNFGSYSAFRWLFGISVAIRCFGRIFGFGRISAICSLNIRFRFRPRNSSFGRSLELTRCRCRRPPRRRWCRRGGRGLPRSPPPTLSLPGLRPCSGISPWVEVVTGLPRRVDINTGSALRQKHCLLWDASHSLYDCNVLMITWASSLVLAHQHLSKSCLLVGFTLATHFATH